MVSDWPRYEEELNFSSDEAEFERIMSVIKAIRNRRSEMNVPPSKKAKVCIASAYEDTFNAGKVFIERLAYASEVEVGAAFDIPGAVKVVTEDATVSIPLNELVDFAAELARLQKELAAAVSDREFVTKKLTNEKFVSKAPVQVVNAEREKLKRAQAKISQLEAEISDLKEKM